ncbi:MAG: hypothetical protein SNJ71_00580 [Bacteroidales bacterium]
MKKAVLTEIKDRKLTFPVEARYFNQQKIDTAKHIRFIINIEKFLSKLIN